MAHLPQLSKVSEVLSIRKHDRHHATDIICQVVRTTASTFTKFKFLTCEVASDENSSIRRRFSMKVWEKELQKARDVVVTDIIRIRKAWKKTDGQVMAPNYVLTAHDLNVEFHSHLGLEIEILFSSVLDDVKDFSFLRAEKTNVTIRGKVDRLPQAEGTFWILMLADANNDVVEVHLKSCPELKTGDLCKVHGDMIKQDGFLLMRADECSKMERTPAIFDPSDPLGLNNAVVASKAADEMAIANKAAEEAKNKAVEEIAMANKAAEEAKKKAAEEIAMANKAAEEAKKKAAEEMAMAKKAAEEEKKAALKKGKTSTEDKENSDAVVAGKA
uniref:OB domain-containing protein n=1 Tax=Panagrolaimus davidi TaxID=227884 RepID=A0A914PYP0_9BILA